MSQYIEQFLFGMMLRYTEFSRAISEDWPCDTDIPMLVTGDLM
jgi:hypothetical protein